ncbi:hypothetical protein Sjap_025838 [Stephania japonica]|uniref:Uncharacterized protein n=1 Tax=Stephania japonica TaxID=461633 RepID=A0AAP0E6V5_9MAGN
MRRRPMHLAIIVLELLSPYTILSKNVLLLKRPDSVAIRELREMERVARTVAADVLLEITCRAIPMCLYQPAATYPRNSMRRSICCVIIKGFTNVDASETFVGPTTRLEHTGLDPSTSRGKDKLEDYID